MIQKRDRRILRWLWKAGLVEGVVVMRVAEFTPKRRWRWLLRRWYERALARQKQDERHHAPGCSANHFHYRRLVLMRCTCGAL